MSPRPAQPEPFLRGAPYPAFGDVPYPRANPSDTARLPADVWHASMIPVGVRLELVGDAEAVDVGYRTTTGNLGYRGEGAGITFSVWRGGHKVCEEEAVLGDGMVRLALGPDDPNRPATVYLPEGMQPVVLSVNPVGGDIQPAPPLPRWLAYGDSMTQGWIASSPSQAWTAITARKVGLDLVNLGYAGAARGEIVSAEHLAELPAEVVTIAMGANCWTRVPHSVSMVSANLDAFLDIVRAGHPGVPIVVISPLLRPDAERVSNRLGSTLGDIRATIEAVVHGRMGRDDRLTLIEGATVIGEEHLEDGLHPGDEGHRRIAAAVTKVLAASFGHAGPAGIPALYPEDEAVGDQPAGPNAW